MRPFVIGITGGSGSGKTVLAEALLNELGRHKVALIQQDSYYKDLSHLEPEERTKINFDHPEAFDNDLLIEHLRRLKLGETIEKPIYDFGTHIRKMETIRIEPKNIIILEGILILVDSRLRHLLDLKVFIDADADIRFIRRLKRDVKERRRSLGSVVEQYLNQVRPMHLKFVEPCKRFADTIIRGDEDVSLAVKRILYKIGSL